MGKLVVFEGIDGSGKSTQFDMLASRFTEEKRNFRCISFPRYEEPSSVLIKMYLGGEFGEDPEAVNAYAASSFFAVDRYASYMQDWRGYFESGGIILTDRYTTSNAIHQGAKLPEASREPFFKWLYEYEFALMSLPAPDLVIYFDLDSDIAAKRLKQRQDETGASADIHEKDMQYLRQCASCGIQAADYYKWKKIPCLSADRERTVDEIHEEVYALVLALAFPG